MQPGHNPAGALAGKGLPQEGQVGVEWVKKRPPFRFCVVNTLRCVCRGVQSVYRVP